MSVNSTDTVRELDARSRDVFVYFKHEEEGKGALFGKMLREKLALSRDSRPGL